MANVSIHLIGIVICAKSDICVYCCLEARGQFQLPVNEWGKATDENQFAPRLNERVLFLSSFNKFISGLVR